MKTYKPGSFVDGLNSAAHVTVNLAAQIAVTDVEREAVAMVAASYGFEPPFTPSLSSRPSKSVVQRKTRITHQPAKAN